MARHIKNPGGFTLLELILSLAIVGFIVSISLGGIRLGLSARDAGEKKTDTFQRLRVIGEMLSQKIKSSYPVFVPPKEISLGATSSYLGSKRILAFEGEKDSLRFVTFSNPISSTEKSTWAHEVRFYLGKHPKTGESGIIMMERDVSDGDVFAKPSFTSDKGHYFLLAKNVSFLKFRYYQWEKVPDETPGATKGAFSYRGKWVNRVNFKPDLDLGLEKNKNPETLELVELMTLPKGVEISLGLLETAPAGTDKKLQLASSPPVLVLLHSVINYHLPTLKLKNGRIKIKTASP